ncbi:hypothetical protein [Serinibacter arcticus]|uniref:hypothetical protein n=1 Tax=Serinibacter arcticus TaxID=1655435 RepID=UPI001091C31F|nr:hypothetical protein [Serinibacter arcticus]
MTTTTAATTTASTTTAPTAPTAWQLGPLAPRIRPALLTGAMTVAYYASPDVVRHRTLRGVVKTALVGGITAVSIDDWKRDRAAAAQADGADAAAGAAADDETEADEEQVPTAELLRRLPARKGATLAAVAGGAMAASIVVTVAAERWIHRRGQARAAAGSRLPHTLPALLWGGIAAALTLIPTPEDTERA